jgi:hypothetical protein
MDNEQIKKTIDSPLEYDESKEDTYCSLLRDFFSKKIRWFTINFYVWSIFFMAVAIISAIQVCCTLRLRVQWHFSDEDFRLSDDQQTEHQAGNKKTDKVMEGTYSKVNILRNKKMNDEQIKKIIDSPEEYNDTKEETYISYARDFFKNSQQWAIILVFVHFFFFLALAILSGILFLISETTKYQIMYAALFVVLFLIAYLIKIFAWVWGSRNIISREIKRLELRIAELSNAVKEK